MKVVHSSFFRAICAIVVGALLIRYREQTVTWITIAIGVLFFLSGVISVATYFSAKRNFDKVAVVYDAHGKQLTGLRPNFPIVGIGSLCLGLILALMPNTFINHSVSDSHHGSADPVYEPCHGSKDGSCGCCFLDFPFHHSFGGFAGCHQTVCHSVCSSLCHWLGDARLWCCGMHQCIQNCQ